MRAHGSRSRSPEGPARDRRSLAADKERRGPPQGSSGRASTAKRNRRRETEARAPRSLQGASGGSSRARGKPPDPRGERLQKILAARGVASRRAAEELIRDGRVAVDGRVVRELGTRVPADARIHVDGREVPPAASRRYLALHKPVGVVSTARDPQGRRIVTELVPEEGRLYPVGRLDADSAGLVILTDDGAWAERVLHPRYGLEREYEVVVRGRVTRETLARVRAGVPLEEGVSRFRAVRVVRLSERASVLRVVLAQGWKRQVRRTLAAVGLPVTSLVRVRIGPLRLGDLRPGHWRHLTPTEVRQLGRTIASGGFAEGPRGLAPASAFAPALRSRAAAPAPSAPSRDRFASRSRTLGIDGRRAERSPQPPPSAERRNGRRRTSGGRSEGFGSASAGKD